MHRSISRALATSLALALGCGGEVAGTEADGGSPGRGGGPGGGSLADSSGGYSQPDSGIPTPLPVPTPGFPEASAPPPITCSGVGGGGSSGGTCTVKMSETCSDGFTYTAECSCPEATCACYQFSSTSASSGGFPYAGCADDCSPSLAFTACGFPQ
jgi:hypothetical protein